MFSRISVGAVGALAGVVMTAAPALAGTAAGTAPAADPKNSAQVAAFADRAVPEQLRRYKIPGAAVVVVAGGRQVFAKGYGVADAAAGTPVDPARTAFLGGSVAKAFTATAVAQLVERGRLGLDDDVNRHLTGFKIKNTFPGRPVTVRHLLTHTAGFDPRIIGEATDDAGTLKPLGEWLAETQPERVRPPGQVVSYDNYAVALAGRLVEIVSGKPFADYVATAITGPLGMTRTTLAQPHPAAIGASLAKGHRPAGSGQEPVKGRYIRLAPTGGLVTTAGDMGRFMLAQLGQGRIRLLHDRTLKQMQARQAGDPRLPGMGHLWERRSLDGRAIVAKDGDTIGFHSGLTMLPQAGAGIYVVYNGDGVDGTAAYADQELGDRFAAAFGGPAAPPAPVASSDAGAVEGTYRAARTSRSELTRLQALVAPIRVTAEKGGLTTSGPLSPDPDKTTQHWVPIGPDLYAEKGGSDRLAFTGGRLATSADPGSTYERLSWYQAPALHLGLLAAGLLILLLSVVVLPAASVVRRLRGKKAPPSGAGVARGIGWLTGALVAAYMGAVAVLMADANRMYETLYLGTSPLLTVLWALPILAVVTTVVMLVAKVTAWSKGWWGRAGRIGYTVLSLAAVTFLSVAGLYGLVG